MTLRFTVTFEAQEIKVEYVGTVDGDTMAGKVVLSGVGEGTFNGTRSRPAQP